MQPGLVFYLVFMWNPDLFCSGVFGELKELWFGFIGLSRRNCKSLRYFTAVSVILHFFAPLNSRRGGETIYCVAEERKKLQPEAIG
jgi:hypothetical protein